MDCELNFNNIKTQVLSLQKQLEKSQSLQQYFELNILFELEKLTKTKCKKIKKKIEKLFDLHITYYDKLIKYYSKTHGVAERSSGTE